MAAGNRPPDHSGLAAESDRRRLCSKVPDGNRVFLEGHAFGIQNYTCLPTGWTFFGPQATLFDGNEEQIITHLRTPTIPTEQIGTPRAPWQHSEDSRAV